VSTVKYYSPPGASIAQQTDIGLRTTLAERISQMDYVLSDLADLVGGQVNGSGTVPIQDAAIIRDAGHGDITLADSAKLETSLSACKASAVVVPPGFQPAGLPSVTVANVHESFAKIVSALRPPHQDRTSGVSIAAHVSPCAELAPNVVVHPGVVIGDGVRIGSNSVIHSGVHVMAGCIIGTETIIFPNVVLYESTVIGDRVLIHAGAVIGAYGFGYGMEDGQHRRTAQLGYVVIEDDVEVGASTTIDRGTYGATTIGKGTKIDNLVQIGHNCRIGRHNLLCAQVAIAGSCSTGDYVVMGGQSGLRDHIDVGNQVMIGAQSGVMRTIPDGESQVGSPAAPAREYMHKVAAWGKLPELRKQFKALQKQVQDLEERASGPQRDAA
jgi:UDP-3-O-[3-hydroxymyristoyl] glucosamine N-acyltransferase